MFTVLILENHCCKIIERHCSNLPFSETTFIKRSQNKDTLKKEKKLCCICIYTAALKSGQANTQCSTILSI